MYAKAAEFKAGIVIVSAVVALVAFLYFAGAEIVPWRNQLRWTLRFEPGSVAPRTGDPVEMNGIVIGKIVNVEQAQEFRGNQRFLFVRAVLRTKPSQVIPLGTEGLISTNIAGVRSLSLRPGRSPKNLKPADTEDDPIVVRQAAGLETITAKLDVALTGVADTIGRLGEFADESQVLLNEAQQFLAELREKVRPIDTAKLNDEALVVLRTVRETFDKIGDRGEEVLANLNVAAKNAVELTEDGKNVLASAKDEITSTLESVRKASQRVDDILIKAEPKIHALLDSAVRAGADFERFAGEMAALGPEARRLLEAYGVDIGLGVEYFKDAARSILDAAEEVRASPWKLLNEPGPDQVANENLRIASTNYMRAMRDVKDTYTQMMELLKAGVTSPQTEAALQVAIDKFQRSMERYQVSEKRWEDAFLGPERVPPR